LVVMDLVVVVAVVVVVIVSVVAVHVVDFVAVGTIVVVVVTSAITLTAITERSQRGSRRKVKRWRCRDARSLDWRDFELYGVATLARATTITSIFGAVKQDCSFFRSQIFIPLFSHLVVVVARVLIIVVFSSRWSRRRRRRIGWAMSSDLDRVSMR
jgi:hypothetical protein